MRKSTEEIANEIDKAESWDDLYKLLEGLEKKTFGDRLNELCIKYKKKTSDLQREVAISKAQFYYVLRDEKNPGKETVIKIALTLGTTVEEINELLKLSHHKELYPKNKVDAIIIWGLNNKKSIYEIDDVLKSYGSELRLVD